MIGEASMKLQREERSGAALIIFNRSSSGSLRKTCCEGLGLGAGQDEDVGDIVVDGTAILESRAS
jgi:hypothetical protein